MVTGVEGIENGQAVVRIMVKTEPDQHWAVLRQMRKLVVSEFRVHGIDLALPRQDVRITQTGETPPY